MPSGPETDLCLLGAVDLARLIRSRETSAVEVMRAHLERIEQANPAVNAIVTFLPERALEGARRADRALHRGEEAGPLHGLPVAHKDLADTAGIRTTYGSRIYKDHVPERDNLTVERLKRAGAISVGKTNTPEFGAGSQTFNAVFGATRNPYDLSKTCGGSSGGAAVALACGMLPIADGSDMGGSLRNPAAFCNVVGLRPSPGRVPSWPSMAPWSPLSVEGPMGRSVEDVALMLSAIAGPDPRAPLSISEPGGGFDPLPERDFRGTRIAWSPDLGGLPVERQVREVFETSGKMMEEIGCGVDEAAPDFSGADEVFKVLRAWQFELAYGGLLDSHRDLLKDTVVWNIEEGRRLTGPRIGAAERQRAEILERVRLFMERYEFLVLPTTQVAPFGVRTPYVEEIDGEPMETYIDWMKSCYYITVTGLPAVSVPGGFTPEGLPVGVQIVGRWRDEIGVLQLARAFERATRFGERRPEAL
ncbi:MAG TPA: amidase [Rubrobacteraceae bacterium]|nr:amidase [Rubrobacteraceae bacterium]